ncbi:MAG: phosphatase domain-containing protein [Bacteroidota bacterium]
MARTPYIFPFQGIRTADKIYFEGQILHVSGSGNISKPTDSIWRNLKRTFQLYTPVKIKKTNRVLEIILNNNKYLAHLDKYGYFNIDIEIGDTNIEKLNEVKFFLGNSQIYINRDIGLSSLLINNKEFETGVLSDIDDTIIVSHSTNKLKKTALVGLKNAYSRKIVTETKELFETLDSKGCQFFYVSNSETNLYLLIKWMLRINNLPNGPVFLKRIKNYKNIFRVRYHKEFEIKYRHKIGRIINILELFPTKKFILVGDSGQGDPEIYRLIASTYPNRIIAVLIRDITNSKRRETLIKYENELKKTGIPFLHYSENKPVKNFIETIEF